MLRTLPAALLVWLLCSCAAPAPPTMHIDWAGTFSVPREMTAVDPNALTGQFHVTSNWKVEKQTTEITASLGTRFGIGYTFQGPPNAYKILHNIVWRYPGNGITNPDSKLNRTFSERQQTCFSGAPCFAGWIFTQTWEVVPGTWKIEIWADGHQVGSQSFHIFIK